MKTPDLNLPDATLEERVAAFRSDPQLMEAATKFVNEVIEKAKEEALRRLKEKALNMKTVPGATLQERMAAFRSDPQLMEVVTKFVNELNEEALQRLKEKGLADQANLEHAGVSRKRGRWHSRARGFFLRVFASLCLCNSDGAKGS